MPLLQGTQQQYYGSQEFSGNASAGPFTLSFPNNLIGSPSNVTMPVSSGEFSVAVGGVIQLLTTHYTYNATTYQITFTSGNHPASGVAIVVSLLNPNIGNYQFINLTTIINNFLVSYVGQDKIISKVRRADIAFHAQRAIQELSYDTFKSEKSQEIELGLSLKMKLPHDYVNYVKVTWKDTSGIERIILPARQTSNPTALMQDSDYGYLFDSSGNIATASDSDTWTSFKASTGESDANSDSNGVDETLSGGRRYGLEPERAHGNGVYYIDPLKGTINFSSDLSGKTITLKYISDGLGTENEMIVHKFAEEAMYKWIAHAILSTKSNVQEYLVARFKKERYAAVRTAKLRLSNIKLEELTQVMRGKSKVIKH
jgi:hypothetical protein